ncbi:helix-turn-helix transcriptional regulator [Romboutsia sp. MSSM.1001216sp_RTP31141st1_G3_RTP31141_220114]|uniref:helix-turn-helix domain-containing protein n=1 Tax=unclassified Romboutsia TaxID=2626894 RepID=UPI0031B5B48D
MKSRLKEIRKALNLTQKEFGEKIGLSDSNISNLEKGNINLIDRNIKSICAIYNVNREWFETGKGEMFLELTKEDEFNILVGKLAAEEDSFKKRFIEEILKLNDDEWCFVEEFIKRIKN